MLSNTTPVQRLYSCFKKKSCWILGFFWRIVIFLWNCKGNIFFLLKAYSKLGPLKRKLYVIGKAVPTCKEPEEMPSGSHREEDTVGKSDGHITAEMIKALFKENVDEN